MTFCRIATTEILNLQPPHVSFHVSEFLFNLGIERKKYEGKFNPLKSTEDRELTELQKRLITCFSE